MVDRVSVAKLFKLEGEQISDLSKTLNMDKFRELCKKLEQSHSNIFVTGCGTSAMAARKVVHTFNVINLPAFYLNPSDAVHGGLGAVHTNDIVIVISKGGNTSQLTEFMPNLMKKKTFIVAVTESGDSEIAKAADLVLVVRVQKELDTYNMLATTSTLAVISVFDALTTTIMEDKKFTEKEFLLNHPSGAVGERLKEDVND